MLKGSVVEFTCSNKIEEVHQKCMSTEARYSIYVLLTDYKLIKIGKCVASKVYGSSTGISQNYFHL